MIRITNSMIHNDIVGTLNRQKTAMKKIESELSTGVKIQRPSDDPTGAANQMIYKSRLSEFAQYDRNVNEATGRLNMIDGQIGRATDLFQRVRELSIQAANGTNSKFELREAIGKEIEQHLMSLVDIANSKDSTGRNIFGGSVIERDAFRPVFSNMMSEGLDNGRTLTGVIYQGDNVASIREIERYEQMEVSIPGSKVFWGTNMSIASNKTANNFVAAADMQFAIDGIKIDVSAGDNLQDIVSKINQSPLEVSATIGGKGDLILTSDTPHKIWLEDIGSSTVLQNLGMVDPQNPTPGNNIHPGATTTGLSSFDVLIQLRNDLMSGNQLSIGGKDLEAIDMAMNNLLRYRAEVGSRVNRLELHSQRIAWDKSYTQKLLAENESIDVVESIVNMKWLQSVHSYALRVGAGLIKPTLMDFLR